MPVAGICRARGRDRGDVVVGAVRAVGRRAGVRLRVLSGAHRRRRPAAVAGDPRTATAPHRRAVLLAFAGVRSSPLTSCCSTPPSCGRRQPPPCSSETTPRFSSGSEPGPSSETPCRGVLDRTRARARRLTIVFADASSRGATMPGSATGDLLALSAAIFWAAYMVTTERVRTEMDTLTFNTFAIGASVSRCLSYALRWECRSGATPAEPGLRSSRWDSSRSWRRITRSSTHSDTCRRPSRRWQ